MTKTGRIIRGIGGLYTVDTQDDIYACKPKGLFRLEKISPLVGDFVDIDIIDDTIKEATITTIHPRKNQMLRPKITNVDQSVLVFTLVDPAANFDFLDRISILSEKENLDLVIVINKMDKVPEGHEALQHLKNIYEKIGYQMIYTSTKQNLGIDEVSAMIADKVSVFCGLSGVGKSSLINLVCPDANMQTGEISNKNKKGKHTTRYTNFIKTQTGYVADSPGFSSLEFNFPKADLAHYFKEFAPFLGECRFTDCSHIAEPSCAVKAAVGTAISQERYDRYVTYYKD